MLTSLVSTKIVAVVIGPSGVALLGQFTNFITIVMSVASAGINNGITKYISEYKTSERKVKLLISTAFRMILCCSSVVGLVMILFNRRISSLVLLDPKYGYVFVVLGFTVILYAINNLLIAVVNGFKEFKLYTYINIAGSIFGLIFSVVLVLLLELPGALLAMATYQSVVLLVTILLVRKQLWFRLQNFVRKIDPLVFRKYLKFSIGSIIFIVATPLVQLFLRSYVITELSSTEAGIWEGMNRISAMYMMIINVSLAVYYIPRMSELQTQKELRSEIITAYKFLIPIILIEFLSVYLLRLVIVRILYTPEFYPMVDLFSWQLLLDFINACSYILSYLLIAKAMIKAYTITTLVFSLLYIVFSYLLLNLQHNVVGIIQGNIIAQILYVITIIIIFRKILFSKYHPQ